MLTIAPALMGEWVDVPNEAVGNGLNRAGRVMACPHHQDHHPKPAVSCTGKHKLTLRRDTSPCSRINQAKDHRHCRGTDHPRGDQIRPNCSFALAFLFLLLSAGSIIAAIDLVFAIAAGAAMTAAVGSRVHWPIEADEHLAALLGQAAAAGQTPESGR